MNQSMGAQSGTGNEFEASGTWRSPRWQLPGLHGCPLWVTEIGFGGDLEAGGTVVDGPLPRLDVSANGRGGRFTAGFANTWQFDFQRGNQGMSYDLQVSLTGYRSTSDTRHTPNFLPVIIRGFSLTKRMASEQQALDAAEEEYRRWGAGRAA